MTTLRLRNRLTRFAMHFIPNVKLTARTPGNGRIYFRARQHKAFLHRPVDGTAHERCIFDYYKRRLPPDAIVFDIGANIGIHTVPLGLQLTLGRVVAFEPDPDNLCLLKENIARNGLRDRVRIVAKAAASVSGKTAFWRDLISTATGTIAPKDGNAWYPKVMGYPPVKIEVDGIPVDDYCDKNPDLIPSLVKIDVEGAEAQVLDGMTRLLSTRHPEVIIDGASGESAERLASLGYRLWDLLSGKPHEPESHAPVPFTVLACWDDGC